MKHAPPKIGNLRLPFLLLAFALLGGAYSAVTPIYEAPDEVWHDAYVRWVAQGQGLPPLDQDASGAYQEAAQPPLYYLLAASVRWLFPDHDLPAFLWHNPGFGYQAGGTVNDNKNMLIHTDRERFPWHRAVLAIHITRLVSLLFGLVTVAATWGLAQEATARAAPPSSPRYLPLLAAALVAFTPQFLFISSVVSNDSAAAALSTAALWSMACTINRGLAPHRSLLLGVLIGLATLTKTSGLLLAPLAGLAIILAVPSFSRKTAMAIASHCAIALAAASAIGGWWYVRNASLYGDPLGLRTHTNTPWGRPTPVPLSALLSDLPKVYRSFWGAFGWGHVEFPPWVYLALGGLLIASLTGWALTLQRRCFPGHRRVLTLAALWCLAVFAAFLEWMRQVEAPHGRLLFPAIGAWALLMAAGWGGLPWARLRSALVGGLAILSLLAPWLVIRPAFAPPQLITPAEATTSVSRLDFTFADSARLLGARPQSPSTAPGDWLAVRACWEAVAPLEHDYTVFVQLLGRENMRVAERYTYPGLGRFPTSLWPVGRAFCDVYRMHIEAWAPTPELYDLVIGLYDASSGQRLVARDATGAVVDPPTVARVRLAPTSPPQPHPQYATDYQVGQEIRLIGFDLSGPIQSDGPLAVTLYWQADQLPQGDYTAFVHLLDENGRMLAQHDGPPRAGRYPTHAWQPGDIIPDQHLLSVPALTPSQSVRLAAGMYRSDTLERLAVHGPAGPVPDDLIPLTTPSP